MITDRQFIKLKRDLKTGLRLAVAAARAGMSDKTGRKYRTMTELPSQTKVEHTWRTRPDPFDQVWPEVEQQLKQSPGLQPKTIFQWLQRQHPGQFQEGQLRTLQRRIKRWRANVRRLEAFTRREVRVNRGSLIRVLNNAYSVHSRLIGEQVQVRIFAEKLEVWYAQAKIETIPRLRGRGKHQINYRHVIDWLVRKPGAFADYRYRDDLFPTSRFRMAFDGLNAIHTPRVATAKYLEILQLAAHQSETGVDESLRRWLDSDQPLTVEQVRQDLLSASELAQPREVQIDAVNLSSFDELLSKDALSSNPLFNTNPEDHDDTEVTEISTAKQDQFDQASQFEFESGFGSDFQSESDSQSERQSALGDTVEGIALAVVP